MILKDHVTLKTNAKNIASPSQE